MLEVDLCRKIIAMSYVNNKCCEVGAILFGFCLFGWFGGQLREQKRKAKHF